MGVLFLFAEGPQFRLCCSFPGAMDAGGDGLVGQIGEASFPPLFQGVPLRLQKRVSLPWGGGNELQGWKNAGIVIKQRDMWMEVGGRMDGKSEEKGGGGHMGFEDRVWGFVREKEMLKPGDRVVVALSGGADSVCLLTVLRENRMGLRLRAVHVHHGIRGNEADRDADFVRGLCGRMGVPLEVVYRDVPGFGEKYGLSLEEAGRMLRYEALENVAREWERGEGGEEDRREERLKGERGEKERKEGDKRRRSVWIALAHHRDDSVETILHHLFRGSGLRGLGGIRPVQGNRIRPLLGVGKQEILEYLQAKGGKWCEDSTNESKDYTRNRIRRELIPYITGRINRQAVDNVLRAGEIFAQADQYLADQAKRVWEQFGYELREGTAVLASMGAEAFCRQEPVIRAYLIRHMLDMAAPGQRDITSGHFEQIDRLARGRVGGSCNLPGGVRAVKTYGEIVVGTGSNLNESFCESQSHKREQSPVTIVLPALGGQPLKVENMEFQVFSREKGTEIQKKEYTKWFDYDKIKDTLSVRYRQPGDFLTLPGGKRKTLRRFLIDEKVPKELRGRIPLLAEGNHILWVVGYRISEYYKIVEETHTILQAKFYGGKAYGGPDPGTIVRKRSESEDQ